MTKNLILTKSVLIVAALLLALCSQNITLHSKAYAQLPVPNVKSNASRIITPAAVTRNNNAIITIHTTNSIQGNFNVIKQEEPVIRKAILSNLDNAIFIAKGSVRSAIPVNVNAKIINQLADSRIDTTQGTDMTKRLIADELTNAINTTAADSNAPSQSLDQPTKIAVDNQAICTGISSTQAACTFLIGIHN